MQRLKISAYTDGACKVNPGRGGWGFTYSFEVSKGIEMEWTRCGGKMQTTNNEMELTAFLELLRTAPKDSDLTIHSDSKYVLECLNKNWKDEEIIFRKRRLSKKKNEGEVVFTGWVQNWMNNGWKKKDKKPIANLKLWKETVEECKTHLFAGSTIRCIWVKGHSGNKGNDMADKLANIGVPKRN
jgi:ribonuclease HI